MVATLIWTSIGSESATTVATRKVNEIFAELIRLDRMRTVLKSSYTVDDPFQFWSKHAD